MRVANWLKGPEGPLLGGNHIFAQRGRAPQLSHRHSGGFELQPRPGKHGMIAVNRVAPRAHRRTCRHKRYELRFGRNRDLEVRELTVGLER